LDCSAGERALLVEKDHLVLPVSRQAEILDIARSTVYRQPEVSEEDEKLMKEIDEIYTERPYYGTRRMVVELRRRGHQKIGRKHVRTLMKKLGLVAIYPKRKTSIPHPDHEKHPYLLKNLDITRPNQVWGTDITFIRLSTGWLYLVAFLDWYSRYVVSWKVSITMEKAFCIEALKEALETAIPEISNSDQGSQFTSQAFLDILKENRIRISMDGRGRCLDNVFTERLWRSLKVEDIYLKDYQTPLEAYEGIKEYFHFYNHERPHQSLNYQTPAEVYFENQHQIFP
jgi:putative transposase